MKRLILSLVLLALTIVAYSQTNFKPGYIIKNDGDSIHGLVDFRDASILSKRCVFIADNQTGEQTFLPGEIESFTFDGGKYFISKTVNGVSFFLEYLVKGKVSLYSRKQDVSTYYYIDKDTCGIIEIPYEEGVRYKGDTAYYYKSNKHIGILKYYMSDASKLDKNILDLNRPQRKELISLAKNYHNLVCNDYQCIVYEKKLPLLRVDPQLVFGYTRFSYEQEVPENLNRFETYGMLLHFWVPYLGESLFLKTGYVAINAKYENEFGFETKALKIPLQIEYLYPKGIIRPRVSAGFDYLIIRPTVSAGVLFNLGKINVTLDYDISLGTYVENLFFNPFQINYQSLYVGVRVRL